ncbi:hypothetical protein LEM8419_03562 [Neolewinella maritima]|uniref:Uncharacterized protein n=2 Tax=Neolewinella maritima TaxID=1383882 RepID=A0ABN8F6Z4_9BACT|nr:hypothetical protein LEM8419_03562 [Neolewinella maritima]
MLRAKFFTGSCQDERQTVAAEVYLESCKQWFSFVLSKKGLTYCSDACTISADLETDSDELRAYRYLKETIFWKNGFVEAYTHPKVYYCNQPGFVQYALMIYFRVMLPMLVVITSISKVVRTICKVVSFGTGKCDLGPIGDIDICAIYEYIGGCGQFAPSPRVLDILTFHADKAGLQLVSPIFTELPYANTVLFQLQYEGGVRDPAVNWLDANGANLTTLQLLDLLRPAFNLDYLITPTRLIVDRKDKLDAYRTSLGAVEGVCFTFAETEPCAFGDYSYTDDQMDRQGNRLRSNYDDVIEFNPENAEWKTGKCETPVKFGRARFQFDQRGFDKADDVPGGDREGFLGDNFIDRFRTTNRYNVFGCRDDRRERDLLLSNDQASQLKLLVLEPEYNPLDAYTIRRQIGQRDGLTFYAYNYPMYFAESEPEGLWQNFHFIDHPDRGGRPMYSADEATLPYSCELVASIKQAEGGYTVLTELGVAEVEEIEIEDCTITLKNLTVRCSPA